MELDDLHRTEVLGLAPNMDALLPFEQSKASQITIHGEAWGIEESFRRDALNILAATDISQALMLQEHFMARQEREQQAIVAAKKEKGEPQKPYQMIGSTAILGLKGPITKKPTSMGYLFGGTSTIQSISALRAMEADPDVKNILMWCETPGGECKGGSELADQIRATNLVKPITAYIDDLCASMGYFMASQCSAIYMNRMGLTGSISVISVVPDLSAAAAMKGVKVHVFTADGGETYKGAGTEGTAITPEQQAYFKALVNHYGDDFKAAIQMGRGLTDEQTKAAAIGKLFNASEAKAMGLIDGVCSLDECLAMLAESETVSTPAEAAHDPASAPNATAKEPIMRLSITDAFKAILGTLPTETLTKAGITDVNAIEFTDASGGGNQAAESRLAAVEAELARTRSAMLDAEAEAFWNGLMEPDADGASRAVWSQREGVISTFKALALMDGGGKIALGVDNHLIVGTNLKTYMDAMQNAAPNYLQAVQLQGASPHAKSEIREDLVHTALARRLGKEQADAMMKTIKDGG